MSQAKRERIVSVIICSLLFTYLLTFVFEGKVFYSLLAHFQVEGNNYILLSISAHFVGLILSGFVAKTPHIARKVMCLAMMACFVFSVPFFFKPSVIWIIGIIVTGFFGGCAFGAWGFFLKICTPKNERIKTCADVLIISNVLMIIIDVVSVNISAHAGLLISLLVLLAGFIMVMLLPNKERIQNIPDRCSIDKNNRMEGKLKKPLLLLFIFIAVITVNSGLMYQVINPAFAHMPFLVSWYWAVPYVIALIVMRSLPAKVKRSRILYIAMAMIMCAFLLFMVMGREALDYIIIDTLMLGACGIFDLFWWSIIGEMLEYTSNPVKVSGIGLSANVFGVLIGDIIGIWMASTQMPSAKVTVIALCVVCVTLVILPPLNEQLVSLLKSHVYLSVFSSMDENKQSEILGSIKTLDPLTGRENEVLELILSGKSNREIATELIISENTVKTHTKNIFSKYNVGSRAELISTILKNQTDK